MRYEFRDFLDFKNCRHDFWSYSPTLLTIGPVLTISRLCHKNHPLTYIEKGIEDWNNTDEGFEFWSRINKEWRQFVVTYRRQVVMKVAHKIKNEEKISFSEALKKSWSDFQF